MSLSAPSISSRHPSPRRSLQRLLSRSQSSQQTDVEAQDSLLAGRQHGSGGENPLPDGTGPAVLLGVAFLWGTYGPVLKMLYSLPGPPDPAALTAARGIIQVWLPFLGVCRCYYADGLLKGASLKQQYSCRLCLYGRQVQSSASHVQQSQQTIHRSTNCNGLVRQ